MTTHLAPAVIALFVLMNLFAIAPLSVAAEPAPDCGIKALYVAIVSLGDEAEFEEVRRLFPNHLDSRGCSISQLDKAASELGYSTRLVNTTAERLQQRSTAERFACIAWLRQGHYVLLTDFLVDRDLLTVIDPPDSRSVSKQVFGSLWSGEALLIGTAPLLAESELPTAGHRWAWILGVAALFCIVTPTLFFKLRRR